MHSDKTDGWLLFGCLFDCFCTLLDLFGHHFNIMPTFLTFIYDAFLVLISHIPSDIKMRSYMWFVSNVLPFDHNF